MFLAGRSAKLYSHSGNEVGSSYESLKLIYFEIQIYHFGAYTQKIVYPTTEIRGHLCLMLFSSYRPEIENGRDVHQLIDNKNVVHLHRETSLSC